MEELRPFLETKISPEKYAIRAVCFDCVWQIQLISTPFELNADTEYIREAMSDHQDLWGHRVKIFKTKIG